MKIPKYERKQYEFDQFCLDPAERRLVFAGDAVALSPKTFDTLTALVENAGCLLEKDTMHRILWPDTFVEDVTLARSISDLRSALAEFSSAKYIETVPKHGYRFVGEVRLKNAPMQTVSLEPQSLIAVLPFELFDGDSEMEVFSLGLAEELIHSLSCYPGIRVAARGSSFRFRGSESELGFIASELGAAFIVEGSVRKLNSQCRVTAQLIEVKTLTIRWSKRFVLEPGECIEIQDSIAKGIASELKPQLGASAPGAAQHAANSAAWHALWEGRLNQYRFTREGLERAEECFAKAIRLDPNYALAFVSVAENQHIKANLAMAPPMDILPKAAEAIATALALEADSGEVHAAAGVNAVFWKYDWAKAQHHFSRALLLSPSSSSVHHLYAFWWLRPRGRLHEAIRENQEALTLDPLSPFLRVVQAYLLYLNGSLSEAMVLCEAALGFDSQNYLAHRMMGHIWQRQGSIREASKAYELAVELPSGSSIDRGYLASSYALMGLAERALIIKRQLETGLVEGSAAGAYLPSTIIAQLALCLGQTVEADLWVGRAVKEHDPNIFSLSTDPMWGKMRGSAAYIAAMSTVGLR